MLGLRKRRSSEDSYGSPLRLRSADGSPLYTFSSEVASIFRHMMTSMSCNDALPARLSVISALRGEGVTYTTLALATTIASDTAARVCAVELNWWSPGMRAQLDQPNAADGKQKRPKRKANNQEAPVSSALPGLSDVLAGSATLNDALIQTDLPNLSLLPAGSVPVEQRPMAARSAALRTCIDELGRQFDQLVLDIPAILATSDAIALASLGGGCCLVVRQGVTSTGQVQSALDDVKHLRMLGVVLNQVDIKTPRWIRNLIPQDGVRV